MGASRDLTSGYETGTSAALLEHDVRRPRTRREASVQTDTTTAPAPRRLRPGIRPHEPRKRGRLGSKQVVSVRGRRVTEPTTEAKRRFSTVSFIAIPLLIIGVVLAMVLSGMSTQQTFALQELQTREQQVSNEVETLNRDLENLQSSAEIARRANEAGMVVPADPGIVEVENDGTVSESRAAGTESHPIIDVNGAPVRPGRASSDPNETEEVSEALEARPGSRGADSSESTSREDSENAPDNANDREAAPAPAPAVAPYSPNVPAQF